jgi:hypothetical protein
MTPALLAALRRNAQRSTGPRTAAGKQNSKFNSLKHGGYAALEHHHQTMLALGEDPEKFERLKRDLAAALGPENALSAAQLEYLAKLCWRRARRERAKKGRLGSRSAPVQGSQPHFPREMANATVTAT